MRTMHPTTYSLSCILYPSTYTCVCAVFPFQWASNHPKAERLTHRTETAPPLSEALPFKGGYPKVPAWVVVIESNIRSCRRGRGGRFCSCPATIRVLELEVFGLCDW